MSRYSQNDSNIIIRDGDLDEINSIEVESSGKLQFLYSLYNL